MISPIASFIAENHELRLVIAVALGFGFGFVLERAGFGRASKLVGQFYLHDMTVFKVMFSGILTAMLLLLVSGGLGLMDLSALAESAASTTYMGPMLIGGLLLGAGFVISGYCPGTSIVASASGNIDGIFAFGGVAIGSVVFAELIPASSILAKFYTSGDKGQFFLYQDSSFGIAAPILAAGIVVLAIGAFFGAEWVERWRRVKLRDRPDADTIDNLDNLDQAPMPRKVVFSAFGAVAVVALATLALPTKPQAAQARVPTALDVKTLAQRVVDAPWSLRVIDLRARKLCTKQRVPGSECVPAKSLPKLGLANTAGARDLVLIAAGDLPRTPKGAEAYPGRVLTLKGGFAAWHRFALAKPDVPKADASAQARQDYVFRSAFHAALTGRKAPPPPKVNQSYVPKRKKKKGGGCS